LFRFNAAGGGHGHLDWPWSRPVGPNVSRSIWAAAIPVITIMDPSATYCRVIANRALLQFLDISWGWGPSSWRKYLGGIDIQQIYHFPEERATRQITDCNQPQTQ